MELGLVTVGWELYSVSLNPNSNSNLMMADETKAEFATGEFQSEVLSHTRSPTNPNLDLERVVWDLLSPYVPLEANMGIFPSILALLDPVIC